MINIRSWHIPIALHMSAIGTKQTLASQALLA